MNRLLTVATLVLLSCVGVFAAQQYYSFPDARKIYDNDRVLVYQNASGSRNLTGATLKKQVLTFPNISGNLVLGQRTRILGDYANASTVSDRVAFQSSVTNGVTTVGFLPNGTSKASGVRTYNNSDPSNASYLQFGNTGGTAHTIVSNRTGTTGVYQPVQVQVDGGTIIHVTASGTSTAGANPLVLIGATTTTDSVSKLQVAGNTSVSGRTLLGGAVDDGTAVLQVGLHDSVTFPTTLSESKGINVNVAPSSNTKDQYGIWSNYTLNGTTTTRGMHNIMAELTMPSTVNSSFTTASHNIRGLSNYNGTGTMGGLFGAVVNNTIGTASGSLTATSNFVGIQTTTSVSSGATGTIATNPKAIQGTATIANGTTTATFLTGISASVTGGTVNGSTVGTASALYAGIASGALQITDGNGLKMDTTALSGTGSIGTWKSINVDSSKFAAATNHWDLHLSNASAKNFISGNVQIGSETATAGAEKLQVTGSQSLTGNLNFTGTGNRITGDFSDATPANRVLIQSSIENGRTKLGLIPNGTGNRSEIALQTNSDAINSTMLRLEATNSSTRIISEGTGTGVYTPLEFYADGQAAMLITASGTDISGNAPHVLIGNTTDNATGAVLQVEGSQTVSANLGFTGSGNRITGDFSNATFSDRIMFRTSTADSNTSVGVMPNGATRNSNFVAYGNDDVNESPYLVLRSTATSSDITSARSGTTGVYTPLVISADGAEAMRVTASGTSTAGTSPKVLIGGTTANSTGEKLQVTGSQSLTGNLNFTGTAPRILGDMSTSTYENRLYYQTSVVNGGTQLGVIPNGTSNNANIAMWRKSTDLANSSYITTGFPNGGALAQFVVGRLGTDTYLPLKFTVDGSTPLYVTASGTSTAGANPLVLIGGATSTTDTVNKLQVTGGMTATTNVDVGGKGSFTGATIVPESISVNTSTATGTSLLVSKSAASGSPSIGLYRAYGTNSAKTAITTANQGLGTISFNGFDGTNFLSGAFVTATTDDFAPATNSMPSRLAFFTTANGASAPVGKMYLKENGNLILNTSFAQSAGNEKLQVTGKIYSTDTINVNQKVMMTPTGGVAVKLTNKTGAASVKGNVVTVYDTTAIDNAVKLTVVDIPTATGVIYEDGVADGSEVWVVINGIAEVYFGGNTVRGYLARTTITGDSFTTSGVALAEAAPSTPFATDKHFMEIGHVLESRTGAGLAKVMLHFN